MERRNNDVAAVNWEREKPVSSRFAHINAPHVLIFWQRDCFVPTRHDILLGCVCVYGASKFLATLQNGKKKKKDTRSHPQTQNFNPIECARMWSKSFGGKKLAIDDRTHDTDWFLSPRRYIDFRRIVLKLFGKMSCSEWIQIVPVNWFRYLICCSFNGTHIRT